MFNLARFVVLAFMIVSVLSFSVVSVLAKGPTQHPAKGPTQHPPKHPIQHKKPQQIVYLGLVMQVDRTNSNDVTFSMLDRHNTPMTFHLTSSTQFVKHQSASQLAVNLHVAVKAKSNATGGLDATWVQIQQRNQAPLSLKGVVATVDHAQKSVTLALNDGTMLTITIIHASITKVKPGAILSLQAQFDRTGSLVASAYHITASRAGHFQVSGIISHINVRSHSLTLVAPSGASFSIVQSHASNTKGALHVGEKVKIGGSTDSKGNLNEQSVSVEKTNEQQLKLEGVVSAVDTTANTFSLIDEDGNIFTLNVDPGLLASIIVGGTYVVEASIAADGSLTAVTIVASQGNDQGNTLSLEGVVQAYDVNSGLLSFAGDNGESFTLLVNSQTQINADAGASAMLAVGQQIHATVQLNSDGKTYTALTIEIQDNASSGDEMTFGGSLLSFDATSGLLTISTSDSQTLSFATNAQTEINGALSLDTIPVGTILKIDAQVQPDGSYIATTVEVPDSQESDNSVRNVKV
ncbi:MAG: hypothetical protein NVSMB27_33960 [Ktedonobacteraceae bacterium]